MNNLKFRAWHKEQKRYYEVATLDFYEEVVGLVLSLWGEPSYEPGIGYISAKTVVEVEYVLLDEVIIEQYTGLKDKNGKEIYVGDIVEYDFNNEAGVCKFDLFGVYFEQEDGDTFGTTEDMLKELRVIGNIQENKELL